MMDCSIIFCVCRKYKSVLKKHNFGKKGIFPQFDNNCWFATLLVHIKEYAFNDYQYYKPFFVGEICDSSCIIYNMRF